MLTYVAGFDGTEASRAAVRFAAELRSRTGAEVIAAHVYSPLPVGHPYAVVPALGEEERKRRADAERLMEALDEEGIERRAVPASSPAHGLSSRRMPLWWPSARPITAPWDGWCRAVRPNGFCTDRRARSPRIPHGLESHVFR